MSMNVCLYCWAKIPWDELRTVAPEDMDPDETDPVYECIDKIACALRRKSRTYR